MFEKKKDLNFDVISLCKKLISIDSINPFHCEKHENHWRIDGREAAILEYCEAWLQACGCKTWRQPCGDGRENLLAEKGEGTEAILLYGHVDTVEVKDGWSKQEALKARKGSMDVDGTIQPVLFGLGANDMKGGVAILLQVMKQISPKHYRLKIALGCDEEFWSLGSHILVNHSAFLDDVIGVLVPEVGESTSESLSGSHLVTLGRCGRVEFVLDVPGRSGHGADPEREDCVNAITQAAHICLALESYSKTLPVCSAFGKKQAKASIMVSKIEGGNGTLSVPEKTRIWLNRVLIPGETPQQAQRDLHAFLSTLYEKGLVKPISSNQQKLDIQISERDRPTPSLQPYLMDPFHPFLHTALQTIQQHTPIELGVGVSVADENRFGAEAKKPVIVLGPRGENSHAAFEWVTIESLQRLVSTYSDILNTFDCPTTLQRILRNESSPIDLLQRRAT